MARRVFFSFHYQKDWSRMWNVRKSGQFTEVAGDQDNVRLFASRDTWESLKRQGDDAIKNFINSGLKYSGVTVVIIGEKTYKRRYVKYEIKRSEELDKGMLGIYVHNITGIDQQSGAKGDNPFNHVSLSKSYRTYDWVNDRGSANFSDWVERAATDAGR